MNRRAFLAHSAGVAASLAAASPLFAADRVAPRLLDRNGKPIPLGMDNFAVRVLGLKGTDLVDYAAKLRLDTLFITDLPAEPILVRGLEARLAQVFVNLVTNAISFCDDGDAVRVWARRRENRVLVVVEDTGPGIPEQALTKVFKRFYSERPQSEFGKHSGLGLAISKQIVEAHGGVIWAENIRPTAADPASSPLGARFVVGLPV